MPVLRDDFVSIYYQSCPLDRFRERELLNGGGRAISVNRHRFIHAIVPRHVESCVLLERVSNRKTDSYVKLNVKMADYYRIKDQKGGDADG